MINIRMNSKFNRDREEMMNSMYQKFRKAEVVKKELEEMEKSVEKSGKNNTYQLLLNRYNNTNDTYLKDILRDELRLLDNNN